MDYEVKEASNQDITVSKEKMIGEIPEAIRICGDKAPFSKKVEEKLRLKKLNYFKEAGDLCMALES